MNIINDQKKCMASLAVFRQLFNSGNDIFSIVAEFVKQEIISEGLTDFSEQQMHDLLLKDNGFDINWDGTVDNPIEINPFNWKKVFSDKEFSIEGALEVYNNFH